MKIEQIKKRIEEIRIELDEILKEIDNLESKDNIKNNYSVTDEQIERWKRQAPTKKTMELLSRKGFSNQEIMAIKTQYDAHIILNSLKKENI